MNLKRTQKNIKTRKLPDTLLIELKNQTADKNKKLKAKIATLENRSPLLSIKFYTGNEYTNHHCFYIRDLNEYDSNQDGKSKC